MKNILEMIEISASKYPDSIAFADINKQITYSKLKNMSKKVATLFLDGCQMSPVIPGDSVAFFFEKSVDAAIAMFGAVYARAYYSFIDVRMPKERAVSIITVLNPSVVITDSENIEALQDMLKEFESGSADRVNRKIKVFLIEDLIRIAETYTVNEDLIAGAQSDFCDLEPLYVNFTSGSTGTPKGVMVGHRSVIDFIQEFTDIFGITHDDVMANQAPFDFDVSVKDIYSAIYVGAAVHLIPRAYFSNPTLLMDYLCDRKVTTLVWAVSAMCFVSIMNGLEYRTPDTVRRVMFSGELMPVKQLNKWKKFIPDATYVNLYGPTEITCNCTYHILDREYEKDEIIPIGIPFKNEKVFLLDEDDRLVTDVDVEGEIVVGGTCLAIGYLCDGEKTNASFVQNPINDRYYERVYRTGDIGKYDEEGRLIYTTRKDFQIKHMGQRIELGDIEVSAMAIDGVSRACCIYDHKRKKINLYYTGTCDKEVLSEKLHDKLPVFMIPGKTVKLDEFPMNKNGKIDRNVLKEM